MVKQISWLLAVTALVIMIVTNDAKPRHRWGPPRPSSNHRPPNPHPKRYPAPHNWRPPPPPHNGRPSKPDHRKPPRSPLCQVAFLNSTVIWNEDCPEQTACNKTKPGVAPFLVDGENVIATACDIRHFRPPKGRPCMLRYIFNGTVIKSNLCPGEVACNISRGILPVKGSKEAAEAFSCDEGDVDKRPAQSLRRRPRPPYYGRRPPPPPLCKVAFLNSTVIWNEDCPKETACNKTKPGVAPFLVDGENVTATACDIRHFRPPKGRPCMLRYLINGTVIKSNPCPGEVACNISRGILPVKGSKEAAEAFSCDQGENETSVLRRNGPPKPKRNRRPSDGDQNKPEHPHENPSRCEGEDGRPNRPPHLDGRPNRPPRRYGRPNRPPHQGGGSNRPQRPRWLS